MSRKKNTVEATPRAGEITASQQLAACFQSIANSIRSKGVTGTMTPYQMPQKILDAFGRTETAATPSNLASVFSGIANSIRTVSGNQETMTPSEMPQKIQDISTDHPETIVKYSDGTTQTLNIVGDILQTGTSRNPSPTDQIPNLSNAVEIDFGSSVTNIGLGAFYNCTSIQKITFQEGCETILSRAFMNCTGITDVTLPNSLNEIGVGCFNGCYYLTYIKIPPSVSSIAGNTFANCSNLRAVDFSSHQEIPQLVATTAFPSVTKYPVDIVVPDDLFLSWKGGGNWSALSNVTFVKASQWGGIIDPDSRYTTITYSDGTRIQLDISGEIHGSQTSTGPHHSDALPVFTDVEMTTLYLGTGVTSIGDNAFSSYGTKTQIVFGSWLQLIRGCLYMSQMTSCYFPGRTIAEVQTLPYYSWSLESYNQHDCTVMCEDGSFVIPLRD